jgi:hypothetical protein
MSFLKSLRSSKSRSNKDNNKIPTLEQPNFVTGVCAGGKVLQIYIYIYIYIFIYLFIYLFIMFLSLYILQIKIHILCFSVISCRDS